MKELTIEQKAKAYDEAFRIAQELYNDPNSSNVGKGYVCTVFPELQESKDEKIRKELINYFIKGKEYLSLCSFSKDEILAWLEKQGEQNPYGQREECSGCQFNYAGECKGSCVMKRGEQKLIDKVEPKFNIGYIIFNKKTKEQFTITGRSLALQYYHDEDHLHEIRFSEQDDWEIIKPKFHEGEWITNGATNPAQISSIKDGMYFTHNDTIGGDIESIDKEYHLWTIKDAKDGDILYLQHDGKEHIIIYKGVIKERFRTFISAYCAYNSIVDAFCFADVSRYTDIAYGGIMPATKEQSDLLFAKMKDAGYTFDFEKKELKKIENEIEIPFGAKDSELQEEFYCIPKGFHAEIDGNKLVIKRIEVC